MAEAPTAPAPAAPAETAPAPIASLADLDVRMAEIRANPPADSPDAPSVQEDAAPSQQTTPSRPAEPVQGDVPEADEGEPVEDTAKPGGRFARLRQQLTAAEETARTATEQLQQRQAHETDVVRQFVDLVLPDAQFEQLRQQAEGGDWEAKQRLDVARQWRRMAAPIADLAHRAARQQFDTDLADLRTLDGMDADNHQKLLAAATPGDKLRLMWQIARKTSDDTHKERIAALEAEVQTLKTNKAANGAQPAAGGGRASAGSGVLAGWLGADGLPTEEAIQKARNGAFRDLATT